MMTDRKQPTERRQYPRFQTPEATAYAVVKRRWPDSSITGDIIDVSRGGLSLRYVAKRKGSPTSSCLDILLTDGTFHLCGLPLKTISDLEMEGKARVASTARRCGVRFGDLTDKQASDLRHFIQAYTTADPEA